MKKPFGLCQLEEARSYHKTTRYIYRGGVDNDNSFFPVFVEPRSFLRQTFEDTAIAFALEERQLACFGRQPRSGDGHRELDRQKQFSPDTMITMK